MAPYILGKSARTRANENELDIDGGDGIGGCRVNNRIENLSRSTKVKKSSRTDFLIFEAKKTFRYL